MFFWRPYWSSLLCWHVCVGRGGVYPPRTDRKAVEKPTAVARSLWFFIFDSCSCCSCCCRCCCRCWFCCCRYCCCFSVVAVILLLFLLLVLKEYVGIVRMHRLPVSCRKDDRYFSPLCIPCLGFVERYYWSFMAIWLVNMFKLISACRFYFRFLFVRETGRAAGQAG